MVDSRKKPRPRTYSDLHSKKIIFRVCGTIHCNLLLMKQTIDRQIYLALAASIQAGYLRGKPGEQGQVILL